MFNLAGHCYFCQQKVYSVRLAICSFCLTYLAKLPVCCPRCGLPAGSEREPCGRCVNQPPLWQRLVAVSDYHGEIKALLIKFKFQKRPELSRILAQLFLFRWLELRRQQQFSKPDLIMSVPLHKWRRWRRGFNQTELLAGYVSDWLGCRWQANLLIRHRATVPQQSLTAYERHDNLNQAFKLTGSVAGLSIAIFDDIITTGSTLTEISKLLLSQGAKQVEVWCICRTLLHD